MQFHTEGIFTGKFKDIKKSFKIIKFPWFLFLTTPFFLPANQLTF